MHSDVTESYCCSRIFDCLFAARNLIQYTGLDGERSTVVVIVVPKMKGDRQTAPMEEEDDDDRGREGGSEQ